MNNTYSTVIPVFNVVLVPDANLYFKKNIFNALSGKSAEKGLEVLVLSSKEENFSEKLDLEDFYKIAVAGTVTDITENGYVVIHIDTRVNVLSLSNDENDNAAVVTSIRADIGDMSVTEQADHLEKIRQVMTDYLDNVEWGAAVKNYVMQWKSLNEMITALSMNLRISAAEKYKILAEDSVTKRTELIEKALYEFFEITRLTNEATAAQEEDYKKVYREQAIKKQMDYLQNELDEMHPEKVSDIQKFEKLIKNSPMNDEARSEAEKVLNRLKQEGSNSPEAGVLYDYLDFVTSLSWDAPESNFIDISEASKILDNEHYGLKKAKRRILQQIAVMNLKKQQSGSILLFVGAPGTGKTSIGQSIAHALGRKYVRVSLGGVRDEAEIRGHRRTYIGAMPGRIMDGIHKAGVSNPVMVLDEIDKLSQSYNGDPASALLEVLDPEQNSTFTDHYMNVPYDLSNVMFIATANSVETIPEPLLNRMEVIQFPGYTATEKLHIAREHLLPKSMKAMGLSDGSLEITDDAIKAIISDFTMEAGVRGLKKRLDTISRETAVRLLSENAEKIVVEPKDLRSFLDMRPIHHDRALEKKAPGIVTGLAWTNAGGDILYIETILTKGKGNILITGQLGDVMKESAQIAVSLVKSMYPDKAEIFENNDLHIHVPEGAVPKDGPSAGVTLTTAIASLITGRPVSPEIAMTGEISLQGNSMPIGGLPEKLMAAVRADIKKVLIPSENIDDLEDVSDEIKSQLEIIPVKNINEILQITGISDKSTDNSIKIA
ncbi:ATP-dependent Lon protease [Lachnospiraceae bacterium KH1T2]|nr:ATP-dependent Lon protease [Lachnospiraceae bacterium KH1T2]